MSKYGPPSRGPETGEVFRSPGPLISHFELNESRERVSEGHYRHIFAQSGVDGLPTSETV